MITYYQFFSVGSFRVVNLGCWKDTGDRAIQSLEGKHDLLQGYYAFRSHPYDKCLEVARSLGYDVFALQDGGQCFSASNADLTYTKFGESSFCESDGEGGPWANEVYKIVQICEFK